MTNDHTALPLPYDQALVPNDLAPYSAGLSARQRDALQLRWAGFTYTQIGRQLGVSAPRAHTAVQQACKRLRRAKQQAAARPPQGRRELGCRNDAAAATR
jgi:DNA-directed RNA polymerase specialized sigma24 family protein